jgi:hypothetical protein
MISTLHGDREGKNGSSVFTLMRTAGEGNFDTLIGFGEPDFTDE